MVGVYWNTLTSVVATPSTASGRFLQQKMYPLYDRYSKQKTEKETPRQADTTTEKHKEKKKTFREVNK